MADRLGMRLLFTPLFSTMGVHQHAADASSHQSANCQSANMSKPLFHSVPSSCGRKAPLFECGLVTCGDPTKSMGSVAPSWSGDCFLRPGSWGHGWLDRLGPILSANVKLPKRLIGEDEAIDLFGESVNALARQVVSAKSSHRHWE